VSFDEGGEHGIAPHQRTAGVGIVGRRHGS
jgi:hypothetical protein